MLVTICTNAKATSWLLNVGELEIVFIANHDGVAIIQEVVNQAKRREADNVILGADGCLVTMTCYSGRNEKLRSTSRPAQLEQICRATTISRIAKRTRI